MKIIDHFIDVERAMMGDRLKLRTKDIRAITGTISQETPASQPEILEGCSTIYMEGELGFVVNHTVEEVYAMMQEGTTVQ